MQRALYKMRKRERELVQGDLQDLFSSGLPLKVRRGFNLLTKAGCAEVLAQRAKGDVPTFSDVTVKFELGNCNQGIVMALEVIAEKPGADEGRTYVRVVRDLPFKRFSSALVKELRDGVYCLYRI